MPYIRTGTSPRILFTVSGTARMIPAEYLKVHIGTKQRVDTAYYHLAFNEKPTLEEINIRSVYSRNSMKTYEVKKFVE